MESEEKEGNRVERTKNKRLSKRDQATRFAWTVNAPLVIYILCVLCFPMIWGIYTSFTNKSIGGSMQFVGLKNYIYLLTDREYLNSIWNTLRFTFFSIVLKAIFGTMMALALNLNFRGRNLVRALLMIPWTLPNIVAVYNWRWIFNTNGGIANYLLKSFGLIERDMVWFGSAGLAMACLVVANVWRGTPFFGMSILAKLQTIPRDYYEAAQIDGANTLQRFWYITLPEIKDVLILSTLMSTVWTLNEFETVWLLTGGGPNGSTQVMNVYSYKTAMMQMNLGRGIAVAVIAMPFLMIIISILAKRMLPDDIKKRPRKSEKRERV